MSLQILLYFFQIFQEIWRHFHSIYMAKRVADRARFEAIEHTADVGYKLYAPRVAELFEAAGRVLFSTITNLDSIKIDFSRSISVTADDQENLLVAWLSELNYRFLVEHELFSEFIIKSLTPNSIDAVVRGEKIDQTRHEIFTEIKAVTYHGLYIRQSAEGWEAQVIFDV
jgi:SHS2 domain-containing protein